MNGSPPKHGRNIFSERDEGHDWMWVLLRRMGEHFECGESLLIGEVEHARVSLDHLKIEGSHLIKENLSGSKPRSMVGVQDLLDGGGGFSHAKFPSEPRCTR